MLRRRMIDPLIWEDEHFGKLSDKAKILFIACISSADDEGRLSANPSNLRAIAFRFEEVSLKTIEKLISEIESTLINFKHYSVNGCNYIQLEKWSEYQILREDRIKPSKIPPCPQNAAECPQDAVNSPQNSAECPPKLREDKLREDILSGKPDFEAPILYLNEKAKTRFDPKNKTTLRIIRARFNEGRTVDDFKKVIDLKVSQWLTDEKMIKYLRPSTLFNATNFENYLNERIVNDDIPDCLRPYIKTR